MTNIRKTLMIPQLTGKWYRVIRKLTVNNIDTELHITPGGIETPNSECIYIQKETIYLSENQIRHNEACYKEWQRHIDAIEHMPVVHNITGYLIDTEKSQSNLYYWDANPKGPEILPYIMLKIS